MHQWGRFIGGRLTRVRDHAARGGGKRLPAGDVPTERARRMRHRLLSIGSALGALCALAGCTYIALNVPPRACEGDAFARTYEEASTGDIPAVKAALDRDPRLMRRTECGGSTLLHDAVSYGKTQMAAFLLDSGARLDARDQGGMTPLHIAAQNGDIPTMTLLLARGAGVNPRDRQGWTPLDHALKWHHPDAAELLRSHGARSASGG